MVKMQMEAINNQIFRSGDLKVTSRLQSNRKNQQTNKLMHGVYTNEYNSSKYSDHITLESMEISGNEYLSFEYTKFVNGQRINDSVVASYPNLIDVRNFFQEYMSMVEANYDAIYTPNGIGAEFNSMFASAAMAQNKKLYIQPIYVQINVGNTQSSVPGFVLMINSPSNSVEITMNNFYNLADIIIPLTDPFNFHMEQRMNYMMGYLETIAANIAGGSTSSNNGGGVANNFSSGGSTPPQQTRNYQRGGYQQNQQQGGYQQNQQQGGYNPQQQQQGGYQQNQQQAPTKVNKFQRKGIAPSSQQPTPQQNASESNPGFFNGSRSNAPQIDKTQNVSTEKTDMDSLSNEMNGAPINNTVGNHIYNEDSTTQDYSGAGSTDLTKSILSEAENTKFDIDEGLTDDDFNE